MNLNLRTLKMKNIILVLTIFIMQSCAGTRNFLEQFGNFRNFQRHFLEHFEDFKKS